MTKTRWTLGCILIAFAALRSALCQENYLFRIGRPEFSSEQKVELGVINIPNGNLHLEIPLFSLPQRGGPDIVGSFVYDSHIWRIWNQGYPAGDIWHTDNGGWRFSIANAGGGAGFTSLTNPCSSGG